MSSRREAQNEPSSAELAASSSYQIKQKISIGGCKAFKYSRRQPLMKYFKETDQETQFSGGREGKDCMRGFKMYRNVPCQLRGFENTW